MIEPKPKKSAEAIVKDIRRNTRRVFSSEQKILIVMEELPPEIFTLEEKKQFSSAEGKQRRKLCGKEV